MRDPLGPPPARRHPDTVFLMSLCLLAGVGQLLRGDRPASVQEAVPDWAGVMWSIILIVGAVTTLTGVFWRGTNRDAVMIEALGRVIFSPPAFAYAFLIASTQPGATAWLAAAPFIGFAVSSSWRIGQIVKEIGGLKYVLRVMDHAQEHRDEG